MLSLKSIRLNSLRFLFSNEFITVKACSNFKTIYRCGQVGNFVDTGQKRTFMCSSVDNGQTFSLHNFSNFETMVQVGKEFAQRSIVIEDRTNLGNIWTETDDKLNGILFNNKADCFYRWRINGANFRRFLLVEFSNLNDFKHGTKFLQKRYNVFLHSQLCLINDRNLPQFPIRMKKEKFSIKPVADTVLYGKPRKYKLESQKLDNESMLVGFFEEYDTFSSMNIDPYRKYSSYNNSDTQTRKSNLNQEVQFHINCVQHLLSGQDLLSTLQYKLRFFILHQMEELLKKSFSKNELNKVTKKHLRFYPTVNDNSMDKFEIIPFGSEVSGFGNLDSDLDLCLVERLKPAKTDLQTAKIRKYRGVKLLRQLSTTLESSVKFDFIYMRNFVNVQRILRAFVPIIKCRSRLMPKINIDISVETDLNSGIQMAAYLYHCSICDVRVRPFVLFLKSWAKHHKIVQSNPGEWFSSFQLTSLAIAFLQHNKIVPTINEWKSNRNKNQISTYNQSANANDMQEIVMLIEQFFRFMISFDFWASALDLNTGKVQLVKPNSLKNVCYVINPFAPQLNICKTVSEPELERFLSFCKQSIDILSKQDYNLKDLFFEVNDRFQVIHNY